MCGGRTLKKNSVKSRDRYTVVYMRIVLDQRRKGSEKNERKYLQLGNKESVCENLVREEMSGRQDF